MLSRKKQFWVSVPLLIIGIGATIYVLSNVLREHTRTRGIDADIAKQEERAAEIRSKNALLEQTIAYLESEEARQFNAQKIGYKEPDQKVVGVSDLTSAQQWYQSFFLDRL
jgi:PDZ domain-containing secreted protein